MAAKCHRGRAVAVKQLCVFCEGKTEQQFCNQVLRPHLFPDHDGIIHTLAAGSKDNRHIYGLGKHSTYARVRRFILNTIKGQHGSDVYFTTFFDVYSLPDDFPGKDDLHRNPADPTPYVVGLEAAFAQDVNDYRFIPYLQLHEFETMLFVKPDEFGKSFENCDAAIDELKKIAASMQGGNVELIDDGRDTAPSKRIIRLIPEYDGRKPTAGPDIAEVIGITAIRTACRHFDAWLQQLEALRWGE